MAFRLPRNDEHLAIVGRNGTGKTQFGVFTLSLKDLRNNSCVILDYKGDELIGALDRAREIGFNEVPRHPGLYILRSSPSDDEATEAFLHRLWAQEDCGLFVDEGYMLPAKGTAFRNILTQGRSKKIPVTCLTQRPIEIDRFVFSESSHVAFFHLNDRRDIKTVREFTPEGFIEWVPPQFSDTGRLPEYHCRWYSIKSDERFVLKPAPSADEIVASINKQLEPKRRFL